MKLDFTFVALLDVHEHTVTSYKKHHDVLGLSTRVRSPDVEGLDSIMAPVNLEEEEEAYITQ